MTLAAPTPDQPHPRNPPRASPLVWLWRDRVVLSALLITGLLIGYQVAVIVLQPTWKGPVTDWLRAALAWPQLAVVGGTALWLSRTRRADARSCWMLTLALFSYTVARDLWSVDDQLVFHHGVPFPTVPDLFFVLQYPFFFLALILMPFVPLWGARAKLLLDCLLWTGAAAALSWYFILAPMYAARWMSPLGKEVSLDYPVGDLFLLLGVVLTLLRRSPDWAPRLAQYLLCLAFACLIIGDSWVALLLLWNPEHVYVSGSPPDLFWFAFYLLVPLAALVRVRLARYEPPPQERVSMRNGWQVRREDLRASLRIILPFVAVLVVSATILTHAAIAAWASGSWSGLIAPAVVSCGLLVLVIVRQEVVVLENEQLRRERAAAQASAQMLQETTRRMDEFLSILSHELKTPLTSLMGNVQLLARRVQKVRVTAAEDAGEVAQVGAREYADELGRVVAMVRLVAERLEHSLQRLGRLVDDLLDESRIQSGRLESHVAPTDLAAIVRAAVEEQRLLAGSRSISVVVPDGARPVVVSADAGRIEQVVTNYLTNALKYSAEDRAVAVRLQVDGETARVAVRDQGVGVPVADQASIWERFHRAGGVTVQSGSDVGIGLGLHISKTIVEQHGGQVGVESTPGQGSTFWFTLQLAPHDEAGDGTSATPMS